MLETPKKEMGDMRRQLAAVTKALRESADHSTREANKAAKAVQEKRVAVAGLREAEDTHRKGMNELKSKLAGQVRKGRRDEEKERRREGGAHRVMCNDVTSMCFQESHI